MVHIKNFHIPYIEAFKKQGHDVFLMTTSDTADFNIPFKKKAFSLKNLFLSFKIRKILKKERFDAVLTHTTLAAFWTRFAMKGLKNKPVTVNTVHGYLFSKESSFLKKKLYLLAEKVVRKCTDYIFVMNEEDYVIATQNKLCEKQVVFINGMGVNLDKMGLDGIEIAEREALELTYVGEISGRKNQIFLVKALTRIPNAHLTLVGDGDERENIEKYAEKHGVADRLTVTGFTKDVKKYLANTDIYVSASTIEGLPFNIIEAMAMHLPIVASDVKGQNDLLTSAELYSLNDLDAFVERVKNTELGARKYDIEKYKLENALEKNMRLYIEALTK